VVINSSGQLGTAPAGSTSAARSATSAPSADQGLAREVHRQAAQLRRQAAQLRAQAAQLKKLSELLPAGR
jgi:hypothetical protein